MAPPAAPPAEGGKGEQPPSGTAPEAGAATHTIIVAPTQGVLRFGEPLPPDDAAEGGWR